MTNLDLETAEELQVSNYGIGGHYDPHFDFSTVGAGWGTWGSELFVQCLFLFPFILREAKRIRTGRGATELPLSSFTYVDFSDIDVNSDVVGSPPNSDVATIKGRLDSVHGSGNGRLVWKSKMDICFLILRISVAPSKHDALFWYNIMRDGSGDMRTIHVSGTEDELIKREISKLNNLLDAKRNVKK